MNRRGAGIWWPLPSRFRFLREFTDPRREPGAVATQVAPFGPKVGCIRAFVYSRPLRGRPNLFSREGTWDF